MRVLQVTAIPVTALRFVTPLARALAHCGHEVAFATGPGRGGDALRAEGFTVHRVPISRNVLDWRNRGATRQLRYLVESRGYDVVHAHTPAAGTVARIAARKSRAARLYTMHGSLWGRGVDRGRQGLYTLLEWALGHTTDLVFTVNSEDAADCVVRARIPESRIVKLPCGGAGVDPSFFVDDATLKLLRHEGREEFGLPPEDPLIVYVGRTVAAKGMGVLARAFARLSRQHRDARLLIVGAPLEGDRRPYNEERIRREVGKEAADEVFWAGFQDDVRRYLAAADVVVLASHREGFGLSLAEAAAMRRPVVATATRGARAVVEHGVTGLLVPVGDHIAVAEALLSLVREPERRESMGEAAYARSRERFSREAVLEAYLEGYRRLG